MNDLEQLAGEMVEELAGLPRKEQIKLVKSKIGSAVSQAAANAAGRAPINKGKARFLQGRNQLEPSEVQAADKNQRQWDYQVFYRRAAITFGGDIVIWDETVSRATGLTNMDRNLMKSGWNMLIESIQVKWGYDATGALNDPRQVPYYRFVDAPATFANAEISVRVGDTLMVDRLPISEIIAAEVNSSQNAIDITTSGYEIKRDNAFWKSNEPIIVTLHTPATGTPPAGDHYIEVAVGGTTLKPNA